MLQLKKPLYPNLEAELRRQGFNYISLAKAIGTSQPYISKRMKGESKWDMDVAFKIADLLGSRVDELFRKEKNDKERIT